MSYTLKPLKFIGSSQDDLRKFLESVRKSIGTELLVIQYGGMPKDFKPMPDIGIGAYEIRVHIGGAWRVIYVARFSESIYVLHAFQKKTQKISKLDLTLAIKRYKLIEVLHEKK